MFNQDFLKNLTILYVEDDEIARIKLSKILKRFFKDVLLAANGLEGYILFQEQQIANKAIDLILSDINMPKMNGIEMLESIRELDTEVPIIYTTARSESEYLLRAIELNVNHYVLKPIDTEDIINRIQEVCEKKYYQNMISSKNNELELYMGVIDNVATVIKMNDQKKITFVNSLLLEILSYEKDEILNKNIEQFMHKDTSKNLINEIWEAVNKGKTWHSDIKYEDKNGESCFINSTIFKIINDDGFEYMYIGFLSTEDVSKQREFKKKIINSYQEYKKTNFDASKKIEDLESLLHEKDDIQKYLNNTLEQLKIKNQQLLKQIDFSEKELTEKNTNHDKSIETSRHNLETISHSYKKALMAIERLTKNNEHYLEDNVLKKNEIFKQVDIINSQKEVIYELRDTIKNIEESK